MDPFSTHKGYMVPLNRSNVDTDAIFPKEFLKRIEQTGFGKFLFYDWRFDEEGKLKNEFILNHSDYSNASILLTKENFGSGSSREHAPWALKDYGFKVIIACSYADIFYNNSFKNGLLLIKQPNDIIESLMKEGIRGKKLTVDLVKQVLETEEGIRYAFHVEPYHKKMLLSGLDEISLTLSKNESIKNFEAERAVWLTPSATGSS